MTANATGRIVEFNEALGLRIRELRERNRRSQSSLGEEVGLTRASVANIEAGRQRLSADRLPEFARALGIRLTGMLAPLDDEFSR